jgi:ornithine cyclodeaminase/alanine dehydrogenase-like protein (mu-crystallin family)
LSKVLPIQRAYAFDVNGDQAHGLARELSNELAIDIESVSDLSAAARKSDVCVTCTPARKFFLSSSDVGPATFVAGVGADNHDKQELDPRLLASNKVVADIGEQCAEIGDLHHAIDEGLMNLSDVYAELGEIVAGLKPGRTATEEITIFDNTGTALQDVAAAALVYERAVKQGLGSRFCFQAT